MNRYKVNINAAEVFVNNEEHEYDGSFVSKLGFKRGRKSVFIPLSEVGTTPNLEAIYPGCALKISSVRNKMQIIAQVQRIFSWYGLAPRFYKTISVTDTEGQEYLAHVVELATGDYCFDIITMRNMVGLMKGIEKQHHLYSNDDFWPSNMVGGRWVDFDNYDFTDLEQYKTDMAVKYNRFATWGNGVKSAYQQFEEIGIASGRGDIRKIMFDLDNYDFENKTVLDIGCSGGYFTNYCDRRGARAIGIDKSEVIEGARGASNAMNYNTEFYPYDFSKGHFVETIRRITGLEKFDYVFFLSMDQHIGFKADYFKELVGDTLFFESNGGKPVNNEYDEFNKKLSDIFESVEFKGVSREGAKRNLFICKKLIGTN